MIVSGQVSYNGFCICCIVLALGGCLMTTKAIEGILLYRLNEDEQKFVVI